MENVGRDCFSEVGRGWNGNSGDIEFCSAKLYPNLPLEGPPHLYDFPFHGPGAGVGGGGAPQVKQEAIPSPANPVQGQTESGCELVVKVLYGGRELMQRMVMSPSGCRIFHGSCPLSPFGQLGPMTDFVENLYGPTQAETIVLPPCAGLLANEKQEKLGSELLERGLQRGIVLTAKGNDIYAYRLCQSAVFYSSQPGTAGKPVKLRRSDAGPNELTKIFDYRDVYIPALKDYLDGLREKPDPCCYLVFGQEVSMHNIDSSVIIAVVVASQAALHDLEKAEAQISVRTPKMEVSNSNELDHLARNFINLCQAPHLGTEPNLAVQYSPTKPMPSNPGQPHWYPGTSSVTGQDQQQGNMQEDRPQNGL